MPSIEVSEERNPAIADSKVAEATLHLKGVTLRARDASRDFVHSVNLCADELSRQVKRHRDKRRRRRVARDGDASESGLATPSGSPFPGEAAGPPLPGDISPAA